MPASSYGHHVPDSYPPDMAVCDSRALLTRMGKGMLYGFYVSTEHRVRVAATLPKHTDRVQSSRRRHARRVPARLDGVSAAARVTLIQIQPGVARKHRPKLSLLARVPRRPAARR